MALRFTRQPAFIPAHTLRKPRLVLLDSRHALNRGLVAFWPLGGTGSAADDLLGMNSAATVNGPLALSGGYAGGNSTTFNGSNQALVPAKIGSAPSAFSIVCLAKSTSTARQAYAGAANSGVTQANFYFETDRFGGGFSGVFTEITYAAPSANVWHAVAVSCPGATAKVYVDGTQVASGAVGRGANAAGEFAIGRFGAFTGGQFFGGQLEAVRLYDRALSLEEVRQLSNEPYAGCYNYDSLTSTDPSLTPASAFYQRAQRAAYLRL